MKRRNERQIKKLIKSGRSYKLSYTVIFNSKYAQKNIWNF
nr:MAG TPA: hypothetical protein [Caudoviricetes sp.]